MIKFASLAFAVATALGTLSASALTLSTGNGPNNSQDGIAFDIIVGANNVTISDFDLFLDAGNTPVDLYFRTGTHVGNLGSYAGWTLHDTAASLAGTGNNTTTAWDSLDLMLAANTTYALMLDARSNPNFRYTNGTGVGNVAASDGSLTMLEGTGFASPLPNSTFAPRVFAGNINYEVSAVPLPASLPLLLGALMGVGLIARRRKMAA